MIWWKILNIYIELWLIIIIIEFLVIWKSVRWNKKPKIKAAIITSEYYERSARTPGYWMVNYEFNDLEGHMKHGSGKWFKKEDPTDGQEILICYDSEKGRSVIDGTYTIKSAKILAAALMIWGIIVSICVMLDLDISRRLHWISTIERVYGTTGKFNESVVESIWNEIFQAFVSAGAAVTVMQMAQAIIWQSRKRFWEIWPSEAK